MNEHEAMSRMVAPGQVRPGKLGGYGGVLQIWVTRACDKSCFGCTQGSNLAGKPEFITVAQFERACISLVDYFGVVGVFGGNPAIHPEFPELCRVLAKYIPFGRRGLWCNNPLGHGAIMRETFNPAVSNLNVHLDQQAFDAFKADWPESNPVGLTGDSRHSPPYVAMQDLVPDMGKRWELISQCDINQHWSAMIGVFRGQLRGYFCEIAGAQAMLHQHDPDYPDLGVTIYPGWWKRPMADFAAQVRYHCHACGVPLRGYGELAQSLDDQPNVREQVTATHADIYKPKRRHRTTEVVTSLEQLGVGRLNRMTDYIGNAKR